MQPLQAEKKRSSRSARWLPFIESRLAWMWSPLVISPDGLATETLAPPQFLGAWSPYQVPSPKSDKIDAPLEYTQVTEERIEETGRIIGRMQRFADSRAADRRAAAAGQRLRELRTVFLAWSHLQQVREADTETAASLLAIATFTAPSWLRPAKTPVYSYSSVIPERTTYDLRSAAHPRGFRGFRDRLAKRSPRGRIDLQAALIREADPQLCEHWLESIDNAVRSAAIAQLNCQSAVPSKRADALSLSSSFRPTWGDNIAAPGRKLPLWVLARLADGNCQEHATVAWLLRTKWRRIVTRWLLVAAQDELNVSIWRYIAADRDWSSDPQVDDSEGLERVLASLTTELPAAAIVEVVARSRSIPMGSQRKGAFDRRRRLVAAECWWRRRTPGGLTNDLFLQSTRVRSIVEGAKSNHEFEHALATHWLALCLRSAGIEDEDIRAILNAVSRLGHESNAHHIANRFLSIVKLGAVAAKGAATICTMLTARMSRNESKPTTLSILERFITQFGQLQCAKSIEFGVRRLASVDWGERLSHSDAHLLNFLSGARSEFRGAGESARWRFFVAQVERLRNLLVGIPLDCQGASLDAIAALHPKQAPDCWPDCFETAVELVPKLAAEGAVAMVDAAEFVGHLMQQAAKLGGGKSASVEDGSRWRELLDQIAVLMTKNWSLIAKSVKDRSLYRIGEGIDVLAGNVDCFAALLTLLEEAPRQTLQLLQSLALYRKHLATKICTAFAAYLPSDDDDLSNISEPLRSILESHPALRAESRQMIRLSTALAIPFAWTGALRPWTHPVDHSEELTALDRIECEGKWTASLERRRQTLQQWKLPEPPAPLQCQRIAARLHHSNARLLLTAWENTMERGLTTPFQSVFGSPQAPSLDDLQVRNAILFYWSVRSNRRWLRQLLLAHWKGEREWVRQQPDNQRWLTVARSHGVDVETWLSTCPRHYDSPMDVTLSMENNPLWVLQMGNVVRTCLSVHGCYAYSTIANAVDVNKRVIYARNDRGRIVARRLIAVDQQHRLVGFEVYCVSSDPVDASQLTGIFDDYCRSLAAHCRVAVRTDDSDYIIERLVAKMWYDDSAIAIAANNPGSEVVPAG